MNAIIVGWSTPALSGLAAGVTQAELAERLGVGAAPGFPLRAAERLAALATLTAYLEALGVHAEMVLRLPNKKKSSNR